MGFDQLSAKKMKCERDLIRKWSFIRINVVCWRFLRVYTLPFIGHRLAQNSGGACHSECCKVKGHIFTSILIYFLRFLSSFLI